MINRIKALNTLAENQRYANLTAGQAVTSLSQTLRLALEFQDRAFFIEHAAEPCHEVARACRANRVWHGDENRA
jgi:hypothetical protein